MRTYRVAVIESEQKAQIGEIRLEQRQSSEVVGAVAWDDGKPRVEQVVRLVEEAPVMDGHGLHRFGRLVLNRSAISSVQDERQRAVPKEVALDLEFRQRVAELTDHRIRRVVDEHFLRTGLR